MKHSTSQVAVLSEKDILEKFGIDSSFVKFVRRLSNSLIEGYWVNLSGQTEPRLLQTSMLLVLKHKTCGRFKVCPMIDIYDDELVFSTKALKYQDGDLIRDRKPIWKKFSDEGKNIITLDEVLALINQKNQKQIANWECVGLLDMLNYSYRF